jgi:tryptophan synthase alpha chain
MYCVSVMGVTGSRDSLSPLIKNKVKEVKKYTSLPVAVGFGISKPSHIEELSKFADAAIIGSAIINVISESKVIDIVDNVKSFISKLKKSSNISL